MDKRVIESYLPQYLEKKNIKLKKSGVVTQLICPFCKKEPSSAIIPPRCTFLTCFACKKERISIIDLARHLDNVEGTEEDVIYYLKNLLKINMVTKKDKEIIEDHIKYYASVGFDLVPVAKNGKNPIEQDWTNKEHKNSDEWYRWLDSGINIGAKTGRRSKVTVIDIDTREIPNELRALLGKTLVQETAKGWHYFYKYEETLPKTRIDDLKIDLQNDGAQVVIFPSTTDGKNRKFIELCEIAPMPAELKDFLVKKITVPLKSFSEKIKEEIQQEDFNLNLLGEGNRNSSLIKLGGILRKELNSQQTEYSLHVLNKHLCSPAVPAKEMSTIIKSVAKYTHFDEKELAHRILTYIKDADNLSRNDISLAVMGTNKGEDKIRTDKALNYLVKEELIIQRGKNYYNIKKLDWNETLLDIGKPINFKMPYFYDVANFNWGDMILISEATKKGKSHQAINIVSRIVDQGLTPYYISLESGSRFGKIALQLGLKDGDFKHAFCADPTKIQLEKNAITILDWLLIEDKAQTDTVFKYFAQQLDKSKGILIIFQQLKEDNSYFAPNMAKQFPALAVRYVYDNPNEGIYGKFMIDEVRDAKHHFKKYEIPCKYNPETRELMRVDELVEQKVQEEPMDIVKESTDAKKYTLNTATKKDEISGLTSKEITLE